MAHRVGLGQLAIYGREYLVAVRPAQVPGSAAPQHVLMLHTLHHAAELRPAEAIDDLQQVAPAPPDQVRLARQLIAACLAPLDLTDFTDGYRADLQRLIEAKIAGADIVEAPPAVVPAPALTLHAALEQSLQAVTPAKAKAKARPAAKRTRAA